MQMDGVATTVFEPVELDVNVESFHSTKIICSNGKSNLVVNKNSTVDISKN